MGTIRENETINVHILFSPCLGRDIYDILDQKKMFFVSISL